MDRRFPRSRPSEWPWWIYWYPYSRLIYHRSVLSHLPVLSTLIRLLYIYPLLLFCLWLLGITLAELPPATGWIFLGLALSDTVHTLLDKATTRLRRAF